MIPSKPFTTGARFPSGIVLAVVLSAFVAVCAKSESANHGVAAGFLKVIQTTQVDTNNNALVNLPVSFNNFQVPIFNRADYNVRIGIGLEASSDAEKGVLIATTAENGRDNFGTNAYPTTSFVIAGGGYRIVTYAGSSEYNVNVAAARFPYDRYLGGVAFNSTNANGGVIDALQGSPSLVLGNHFKALGSGKFIVDLRSLGFDSRTDGVLLVTHAKEEDNFALSQANINDGTWNVFVRDNEGGYEQDPVAFVFIPRTNKNLISGKFLGDGTISMHSGAVPQFAISNLSEARWSLRIPGQSPSTGVLIISPEGGTGLNSDNTVFYAPNQAGDGWEIETRDTPASNLQAIGSEPVVSFVFIPFPPPGVTVSPTNGLKTVGDGGQDSFEVVLHSRPAREVSFNLTSTAPSKGLPSIPTLRFNSNTWHVPQKIVVTGQTNTQGMIESDYWIVLSPAISSDPNYSGLNPDDVSVTFIPPRANPVFPPHRNTTAGTLAGLKASVTNTAAGSLNVAFFGRELPSSHPGRDFTIVLLPDTQNYTAEKNGGKKEMFISQVEWIITNRVERNIVYVTQLGDISNDGDIYLGAPNLSQWRNATNAMYRQEDPIRTKLVHGIPYGVAVGNHEMEPIGDPTGTTSFYNRYFGVSHFQGRSYYGGHYGTNNNNHFDLFSGGGLDFIVLYFEYYDGGDPAALAWANQLLKTNSHRRAFVVTHNMGNAQTPVTHSAQGLAIFNALKTNANLFMMLGGHVSGEGSRQDFYNGRAVRTFVQDYQSRANGGDGWLRLLEFSPSNNVIVAQTYSPWLDKYETDEDSEFFFDYDMQLPGATNSPFIPLGTLSAVPGDTLRCAWPGLKTNTSYEWFVTVSDSAGLSVTSSVWGFTTALTNSAPIVVNVGQAVTGDSPSTLRLTATDINGDPLTFEVPVLPNRGLISQLNAEEGSLTYTPARGFRGSDRFVFRASDASSSSGMATMNMNVVDPADTNLNSLPDAWESLYGISDPAADDDDDGQNNLSEYAANTNPTNPASIFRIVNAGTNSEGLFGVSWTSIGGNRYRIEYSGNATNAGVGSAFIEVPRSIAAEMDTNLFGTESTQVFLDDASSTNSSRYYRVKLVQ